MNIYELLAIALALSMDALAVSICKGISLKYMCWKKALVIGLYFGIFQGLMPFLGYVLCYRFRNYIVNIDHWLSFILLSFIGLSMIKNSQEKIGKYDDTLNFIPMVTLAVATSIDALAIGITFAFLKVDIISASITIGITTIILSTIGVKLGTIFGLKYKDKAELIGGIILILIGIKILIQHM